MSEERYRRIVETAWEGIVQSDAAGCIAYVNDRAADMLGYRPDELLGTPLLSFVDPSQVAVAAASQLRRRQSIAESFDIQLRRKDGTSLWVMVSARPLVDAQGAVIGSFSMMTDITARIHAEEALRESEARYRLIVETTQDGIWQIDEAGITTYVNQRMADLLGYTVAEMCGATLLSFLDDEGRSIVQINLQRRADAGHARRNIDHRFDIRFPRKDGTLLWTQVSVTSHFDQAGRVVGSWAIITDITQRKKAEAMREHLAAIVDSSEDAIYCIDLQGFIESWNDGATRLYGYERDEVIGKHISMLVPDERVHDVPRVLEEFTQGRRIENRETRRRCKDGHLIDVALTIFPVKDSSGAIVGVAAIARDITDRLRTLGEIKQARAAAEELARLRSDLVAAVSHELRTPLTAMMGYSELLLLRWSQLSEEQRLERVRRVASAARRQARLVEDLLLLSRLDTNMPLSVACQAVPIAPLAQRAAEEVQGSYPGQRIDLLGAADVTAFADPDRTLQILSNLVDNAGKYSPEGSPIAVSWQVDGDSVAIHVSDRGVGIPEHSRHQLFTRFGRIPGSPVRAGRVGTGLGLYLSRQLARNMGGDVDVEVTSPQGSIFRLTLPRLGGSQPCCPAE